MNHLNGKIGAFVIKVDLAKAYDNLNQKFMINILNEVKIPTNLIGIIMKSITTVNMKVLWNGNECNAFVHGYVDPQD